MTLAREESTPIPLRPARGEDGQPAPEAPDAAHATATRVADQLRVELRWPAPRPGRQEPEVTVAYVAWGPRSDRMHFDPGAHDRALRLVARDGRVVAKDLFGSRPAVTVVLTQDAPDGVVRGVLELPLERPLPWGLNLILMAPGGGEWSWGGEWSMRAPLKPWLWGSVLPTRP
jgi:hypothetical protein